MHFVFLSDNMKFSGGRKLLFEYATYLREQGHQVDVLVQEETGTLAGMLEVTKVADFSPENIPECEKIIATTPGEVKQAYEAGKGYVIHFCQGFEITDLQQRVDGKVLPPRFQGEGFFHNLNIARKKRSWQKKIEKIDSVYRLPTTLVAVSKHLQVELQERYKRDVYLCENGIHREFFYPEENFTWQKFTAEKPLRIINIGPYSVTFKGIDTTLSAIEMLKDRQLPIEFIRVAPSITDDERHNPLIDHYYESLSQKELGDLIRSSHVYISNSTEGEGFGLPALEAISSGVIPVLSSINSYRNFSETCDFCYFVPEYDAGATAVAIEKILSADELEICEIRKKALQVADRFSFERSCQTFEKILIS